MTKLYRNLKSIFALWLFAPYVFLVFGSPFLHTCTDDVLRQPSAQSVTREAAASGMTGSLLKSPNSTRHSGECPACEWNNANVSGLHVAFIFSAGRTVTSTNVIETVAYYAEPSNLASSRAPPLV